MPRVTPTDTMPDFSGWVLKNGRYLLLEKLGAGAYGKVYRAQDTTAKSGDTQYYAIKCLLKHPNGSKKDELQQREISIHHRVSGHPNIVSFYECFHDHHYVFVVMGLYTGGDLFAAITEKRAYENQPQKIKADFIQILDAVQHCHDLGVFHRDVKPENIMCSEDGSALYLGDFGLSSERNTSWDYGCGSSFYMSPECIGPTATGEKRSYSNRHNDIWALGVILTNMITGRNPWRLATPSDPCFLAYSKNSNFLKEVLPISRQVNSLLQQVFRFPPGTRISISELRRRTLAVDAFYDVQDKNRGKPSDQENVTAPYCTSNGSDETSYSSLDSEQYNYGTDIDGASLGIEPSPTLHDGELVFRSDPKGDFLTLPAPPTRSSAPIGSGSDTDGSKGPITPASDPIQVKVGADVALGGSFTSKTLAETPEKVVEETKGLLKSAYERLKAL